MNAGEIGEPSARTLWSCRRLSFLSQLPDVLKAALNAVEQSLGADRF